MRIYAALLLVLLTASCTRVMPPTYTVITSTPPGAAVYAGRYKSNMRRLDGITPFRQEADYATTYWEPMYFQVKKPGYRDSNIVHLNQQEGQRHMHFELTPYGTQSLVLPIAEPTLPQKLVPPPSYDSTGAGYAADHSEFGEEPAEIDPKQRLLETVPSSQKEQLSVLLPHFEIEHIPFDNAFKLSPKSELSFLSDDAPVQVYVSYKNRQASLFIKLYNKYKEWLIIKSVMAKIDDTKVTFDNVSFERDQQTGTVVGLAPQKWEWDVKKAEEIDIVFLNKLVASQEAIIRFIGQRGSVDRTIVDTHKQQIRRTLQLYTLLQ